MLTQSQTALWQDRGDNVRMVSLGIACSSNVERGRWFCAGSAFSMRFCC
jgi:hypothetical protein